MKILLVIVAVCSMSCSAVVINRESPLAVPDACAWKIVPYVDATAGVVAGIAATQMTEEYKKKMAIMAATGFIVSAIMGGGEILELECPNVTHP